MKFKHMGIPLILVCMIIISSVSCSSGPAPLEKYKKFLSKHDEYSIILADMRESGFVSISYYHKYKLVYAVKKDKTGGTSTASGTEDNTVNNTGNNTAEPGEENVPDPEYDYKTVTTDWEKVSKSQYRKYYNYLGMALVQKKKDGKIDTTPVPAGYRYVGNHRYGRWMGSGGSRFWSFYGKYAFFSSIFRRTLGRRVHYGAYDSYTNHMSAGRPYFGPNKMFGTNGSTTKTSHAQFFTRNEARAKAKKANFAQRVKNRTTRYGRSRSSSYRSRSGGFGK